MVRGRHHQCRAKLHRPASAAARIGPRSFGKATTRKQSKHITYQELHEAGLPPRQCPQGAWRRERRHGHDLSADDSRGGLCDARLRADRRGPFGGVRRLLAEFARRPDRGLPLETPHHRRRRAARRPRDAAEGPCRRSGRENRRNRRDDARRPAHRRRGRLGRTAAMSGTTRPRQRSRPNALMPR